MPLALGLLLLGAQPLDERLGRGERGRRLLVLGVEPDLALVEPGDLGLEGVEVGGGRVGPRPGLGDLRLEPLELGAARLEP